MSQNLRQTFRYPANAEREPAVLKLKRNEVPARLVNESAGGFGVCVEGNVPLEPGQEVLLLTYSGWHDAQVVHASSAENETCLGLLRLSDYVDNNRQGPKIKAVKYRTPGTGMKGEYIIGLLVILIIPLLPFLFNVYWAETPDLDKKGDVGRQMERQTARQQQKAKSKYPQMGAIETFGRTLDSGLKIVGQATMEGGKALSSAIASSRVHDVISGYSSEKKAHLREILASDDNTSGGRVALSDLLKGEFSGLSGLFNGNTDDAREQILQELGSE